MKDIDVSECCYLINHDPPKGQGNWCGAIHKGACKVYSKDCEYNENCYYKQLKRLEQENKQLKEEIEKLKTAEKQLELIKWLGKSKNGFGLFNDGTEGLSCHCDFNWEWFRKDFYAEDFDSALAGLINSLWQDMTKEEKEVLRGILRT